MPLVYYGLVFLQQSQLSDMKIHFFAIGGYVIHYC